MVYGIRYYGQGNITEDNYVQFIKHDTISSEYLNQSRNFVQHVRLVSIALFFIFSVNFCMKF